MTSNLGPAVHAADTPAPASGAGQPARSRAAALLNTSALLTTTVLLTASEPKLPRLAGD